MLSAEEARKIADNTWSSLKVLKEIEKKVLEKAESGLYSILLDYDLSTHISKETLEYLESLGYKFRGKVDLDGLYMNGIIELSWDEE